MYAKVIVDITHEKLDRPFEYKIPEDMKDHVKPGTVVNVPFGVGNRQMKGYVIEIVAVPEYDPMKIKDIHGVAAGEVEIESKLISLAAWIKENYGSTMIQALKTVLPVKEKIKEKEKKFLRLLLSKEELEQKIEECEKKHYTARERLLIAFREEQTLSYDLVLNKLNSTASVVKALEKKGFIEVISEQVYRTPKVEQDQATLPHVLNGEQQQAVQAVTEDMKKQQKKTYLLHGITGSGKTEVYMEIISQVIKEGKQAIVLIPEIALTYQTVMRFHKRFKERVSIMNSRLSKGERFDQLQRAKRGELDVIIGPRSALFTPFTRLGLIIIDEEHESSYKSEQVPRYHAREVAIERARLEGASVLLGSATPSIEAFYRAKQGEYQLLTLSARATAGRLPQVYTVDLREELKAGNRSILSRALRTLIEDRLKKKEQIILFLNRRGYAGFVSCRSCGHVIQCPHCDVSLSLHNGGKMVCHYCGYEESASSTCPSCNSPFIGTFQIGTQQIESYVKQEFPEARVLRMDMDTTKKKDGHEKILSKFKDLEADILIGTQMIVKGHDFPHVTLVGIVAADLSLHVSDYRAGERTFQLLTQAAGRAGRGEKPGEVVIQTYQPEHYSITAAASQDYESFYEQEILYRTLMDYPPISNMVAIHLACADPLLLDTASSYLKKYIEKIYSSSDLHIVGPADEVVSKINDIYRKVLYLKHQKYEILTKLKDYLERYIDINEGYKDVNIQFDFNPMN